ncbi:MAG: hypothetical protein CMG60_08720 [Candidatus Marinimicrobia bacterium]|nr:hypothetical protein [Candidatus Neomarinimicrobiota bacterium]
MIDFEKELNDSRIKNVDDINEEEFLYKLEMRVQHSNNDRRTLMASLMMVFFIGILTITQYGVPDRMESIYYISEMENVLETDLWNISSDSLSYYESYFNEMAYYLLEEGYVWETYELLYIFEQEKEI